LLLIALAYLATSLSYNTIKLGISPMPSSSKAYHAMLKLIDETGSGPIIDLGSGWGNFVIPMAKNRPQRQVVGYELSLLPWFTSVLLKKLLGLHNLTLHRKNFYQEYLPEAAVLVCYLFPAAMNKIADKLRAEQPKIDFLISNNFALPSLQPSTVIKIDDFYKSPIYLYKINEHTER
jgi:hypothetical protein